MKTEIAKLTDAAGEVYGLLGKGPEAQEELAKRIAASKDLRTACYQWAAYELLITAQGLARSRINRGARLTGGGATAEDIDLVTAHRTGRYWPLTSGRQMMQATLMEAIRSAEIHCAMKIGNARAEEFERAVIALAVERGCDEDGRVVDFVKPEEMDALHARVFKPEDAALDEAAE